MRYSIAVNDIALDHAASYFACKHLAGRLARHPSDILSVLSDAFAGREPSSAQFKREIENDKNSLDQMSRYVRELSQQIKAVKEYIPADLVANAHNAVSPSFPLDERKELVESLLEVAKSHYDTLVNIENSLEKAGSALGGYALGSFNFRDSFFYETLFIFADKAQPELLEALLAVLRDHLDASKRFLSSDAIPDIPLDWLVNYWANFIAQDGTSSELAMMRFWLFSRDTLKHELFPNAVQVTELKQTWDLSDDAVLLALQYPELSSALSSKIDLWLQDRATRLKQLGRITGAVVTYLRKNKNVEVFDVLETAKIGEAIILGGRTFDLEKLGNEVVRFLLAGQSPDGGWPRFLNRHESIASQELDTQTTVAALRTIILSDIDVEPAARSAKGWLRSRQSEVGTWANDSPKELEITLRCLKAYSLEAKTGSTSGRCEVGIGFIREGLVQLAAESRVGDQVGIVLLHMGLEQVFYSLIISVPALQNVSIFDGKYTIGFVKAKNKLQQWFEGEAMSSTGNANIPGFNGLDDLSYLRGEVVHKGLRVDHSHVREVVDEVLVFLRFLSSLSDLPRIV